MLFSLIRPLFPEARVEIYADGGYKGYRYDIYFDNYETVIEVKCSRPKMTERELTEQHGFSRQVFGHCNQMSLVDVCD